FFCTAAQSGSDSSRFGQGLRVLEERVMDLGPEAVPVGALHGRPGDPARATARRGQVAVVLPVPQLIPHYQSLLILVRSCPLRERAQIRSKPAGGLGPQFGVDFGGDRAPVVSRGQDGVAGGVVPIPAGQVVGQLAGSQRLLAQSESERLYRRWRGREY